MEKTQQIESLIKKMMSNIEEISSGDKIYRRDIQDLGKFKIRWNFAGISAFQILELDNYST